MKKVYLFILSIIVFSNCTGYLHLTGNIYTEENNIKYPLDSANVEIIRGRNWVVGQGITNMEGNYEITGMKHFRKEYFYILFKKEGFRTDTLKYEANWNLGRTIDSINYKMTKIGR